MEPWNPDTYSPHYQPPLTLARKVGQLPREKVVRLLEDVACIACYEHETTLELREALLENVKDRTIDERFVDEAYTELYG